MRVGYSLSSEQFSPSQLLDQARRAQAAGFEGLAISDHFHPWNTAQGNSPFVWSMIGALAEATPGMPVSSMVTCPIIRINPVILAQAAATSAVLLNGRFVFGVGTGENLNEHVWGEPWPPAKERLARLREAVDLMRLLWTGDTVDFDGRFYRAVSARLFTLPESPPLVCVSGLGPLATRLAAEIGDGFVTVKPDLVKHYRAAGGRGPVQAGTKACYDADEYTAVEIAHRLWSIELNPGQLNRELATPGMISDAASLITPDQVEEEFPCGPDPKRHIASLQKLADAGVDEAYVSQVGPDLDGFFDLYSTKVLPEVREG